MKPVEIYAEIVEVNKKIDAANTKRLQCLAENLQFIKDITQFVLDNGNQRKDTLHQVMTYHTEQFEISVLDHSAGYNTSQGAYVGNFFVIVKFNLHRVLNLRIDYARSASLELTNKINDVGELTGSAECYAYIIPGDWQIELQKLADDAELESAATQLRHVQAQLTVLNTIV